MSAFFSALLRGGGDAVTPARYGAIASMIYVPLSGVLALGIGDWSGLGMTGIAIASVTTSSLAAFLQARALWSDRGRGKLGFPPRLFGIRLQARLFGEILRVGVMGSFTTITASLAATLMTGLIGRFGVAALAGYGIGMRLEFMVAPLAFGSGTGLTTLVGVAAATEDRRAGRFRPHRCHRLDGGAAARTLVPPLHVGSRVIAAAVSCIAHVAPFYCLFGMGLALNFASQGAGRMTAPFVAGLVRQAVATAGGWFAVERMGLGLDGVFIAIAAGMAVYGCLIAGPLLLSPWRTKRRTA